jgi:hypothetical protein
MVPGSDSSERSGGRVSACPFALLINQDATHLSGHAIAPRSPSSSWLVLTPPRSSVVAASYSISSTSLRL